MMNMNTYEYDGIIIISVVDVTWVIQYLTST